MRDKDRSCAFPALVLCLAVGVVVAFNVDTESPLVFKGPRNSYFGYSVALLENSQGTWLLVGAPRANDSSLPGVQQPGAVFQCNWEYRSSCQPVFIDDVGNVKQTFPKWRNITVKHHKDNQWLGASIDVNVHGDLQIMICAPRWVDHKFAVQGIQLMNGLCYESRSDLQFDNSSAWPALNPWKKQVHAKGYYSYGMGSLGTSAAYSIDGSFSVLGAPGLNDWSGGFAMVEGDSTSKPSILEIPVENDNNSYFGMSVTTARLSAEGVSTVIGGPRAGGYGKIYAYNNQFQLLLVKEGDQLGSGFGSSVCALDLNGDNLDDIVVGAPLYADKLDEGRVYVYMNREFFNLELMEPLLRGSNAYGARFGTAVANLGDLNLDKYQDLAVGAPYEEDSGVIYIYNGAKFGLHTEPSQRIVGKNINPGLRTFGWSFSRPWDVDSNHYEDFAVGAFESNKVVLLRTRTVLDLYASLEISPQIISLNAPPSCMYRGVPWHCTEATICLRYTGQNLPPSSEINMTLTLDTLERHRGERTRLFIKDRGFTEIKTVNELVTLRLNRVTCAKKYTIFARQSRDIITPLQLELEYDIASNSIGIASLCTICPIRNKYNPRVIKETAQFALDCGDDFICQPELNIETVATFSSGNNFFMIEESPYFDLDIIVSNSGEVSYLTVVTIEYETFLYFTTVTVEEGNTRINCMPTVSNANKTQATLECDIMKPVKSGDRVVFRARFYDHGIPYDAHELKVISAVKSAGQDSRTNTAQKTSRLIIPVQMRTEMRLSGASIPGQLFLTRKQPGGDEELWARLSHLYILRNLGPSPMPHGQLTLSIPTSDWLKILDVQIQTTAERDSSSHWPVECSLRPAKNSDNQTQSQGQEALIEERQERLIHYVNCDRGLCSTVTCYVGLMHKFETVYINISLSLRKNVLQTLQISNQLGLMSSGLLEEPDYMSYNSLTATSNVTTTTYIVFKAPPRKAVTWWVLVISISSGILLLYVLAVILWKCGFFRRKQKEELQLLIKSSEAERELLHSDSLSAGSSDVMVLPPGNNFDSPVQTRTEPGLFFYPHLDPDSPDYGHNIDRRFLFQSQSLNRRDVNHGFPHFHQFQTLQHNNNNNSSRLSNRNADPHSHHHQNRRGDCHPSSDSPPNIWIAPPAAPTPPPSFNNEMYLEPLESRA